MILSQYSTDDEFISFIYLSPQQKLISFRVYVILCSCAFPGRCTLHEEKYSINTGNFKKRLTIIKTSEFRSTDSMICTCVISQDYYDCRSLYYKPNRKLPLAEKKEFEYQIK